MPAVVSEICEIPRNSLKIQTYEVQGHPRSSHILISCIDFAIIRQNFYTASNLKDLFHNIHPKRIISFVHAIGLTNTL